MPDEDAIKADIVATRAELAETADALAAKLDVKAQANAKLHAAGEKVGERYVRLRASAPEPVQKAIGKVEQAGRPVAAKVAADKKRAALIAGGAVVALLVAKRVRKAAPALSAAARARRSPSGRAGRPDPAILRRHPPRAGLARACRRTSRRRR